MKFFLLSDNSRCLSLINSDILFIIILNSIDHIFKLLIVIELIHSSIYTVRISCCLSNRVNNSILLFFRRSTICRFCIRYSSGCFILFFSNSLSIYRNFNNLIFDICCISGSNHIIRYFIRSVYYFLFHSSFIRDHTCLCRLIVIKILIIRKVI